MSRSYAAVSARERQHSERSEQEGEVREAVQ
jgi:hypothetical protein